MQMLLLLLTPALFAATIYVGLGRIVRVVGGKKRCFVKRR